MTMEWIEINEPSVQSGIQQARASRKWKVKTDAATTEASVLNDTSCPKLGQVHPRFNWLFCTDRKVSREEKRNHILWTVTADYELPKRGDSQQQENPLADPISISWSSQQYTAPVYMDNQGNAIKNTAGDPFLPPVEMPFSRFVVVIRRNLAAVPSWVLGFVDAVNASAWNVDGITIPKGAAKVEGLSISEWQFRGGVPYRTVEFQVSIKSPGEGGWKARPLSMGFHELDAQGKKRKIMLNGQPCSVPQPLDASGHKAETAYTMEFDVYPEKDFSVLLS